MASRHLPHRLYDRLLRALPRLYASTTVAGVRTRATELALEIVEAEGAGWFDFNFNPAPEVVGFDESTRVITPTVLSRMPRAIASHPHIKIWLTTPDRSARRMSDLPSDVFLRYMDENREAYAPVGREHLSLPVVVNRQRLTALSYRRQRKAAFTDADLLAVTLLKPHLLQALANARAFEHFAGLTAHLSSGGPMEALTQRELEVGFWLSQGKTNREVALIIAATPRTVEKHVENILRKLCVENRTAAAITLQAHFSTQAGST